MIQKMIGVMLMLLSQYAAAMDMTIKGTTVYMSGTVVGGECDLLKKMIETSKIELVVLSNSNGGNANTGYCVGETIRKIKFQQALKVFVCLHAHACGSAV